ncbi:two-component system sensor histidine kinase DesK [Paenibacillus shirakamiensis]|uniref:histidine kinase n=1 Tax=Paenibacillus shirakamiensis TaxID=1265935 RepID=A0ABS4JMI3_9BACL|nr:sensor histidine kinase [Paenibacillus shirakamiensis]MBP2002211.1 two-component system sensor histidine kinase DesK [Paenibacillus shirakamiensis]
MASQSKNSRTGTPIYYSLLWLIYLVFPISILITLPLSQMMISFAILGVFVALYVFSMNYKKYRLLSVWIQILIIAYFALKIDISFLFMAFFPSPIVGFIPSTRQMILGIAGLLSLFTGVLFHYRMDLSIQNIFQLTPAMVIIVLMPLGMKIGQKSRHLREKLFVAEEEIARLSKNEERQRISRDLHDTLGHTLSLITLKGELAERWVMQHPERAILEIRDIQATSRAALRQVRELVSGMNGATIRDELVHAAQILAAAGIDFEVKEAVGLPMLPPLIDNILGMCLRESVTNVVKHSQASQITVMLGQEQSGITLEVHDNGRGVQTESTRSTDISQLGSGVRGMKERLNLVEGVLSIQSELNQGTIMSFKIPLTQKGSVTS